MRTRIIGLGNSILTDDAVGHHVIREINEQLGDRFPDIQTLESEVAGFALIELMDGWDRVVLVDAIKFDNVEPGTILKISPNDLRTSLRLRSVHEVDLPTAIELGRRSGFSMPKEIVVFAIQVQDMCTIGGDMTPSVAKAISRVVDQIGCEIGVTKWY
ncbi:MAG: hydrogenase maturation protease [Pseudomonadota bacterium]